MLCPSHAPWTLRDHLGGLPSRLRLPSNLIKAFRNSNSFRFDWTFDRDVAIFRKDLLIEAEVNLPVRQWVLRVSRDGDGESIHFTLFHDNTTIGSISKRLVRTYALYWLASNGEQHLIDKDKFESPFPEEDATTHAVLAGEGLDVSSARIGSIAMASGGDFDPGKHRAYPFDIRFEQRYPAAAKSVLDKQSRQLAQRLAHLNLKQISNDLRLFFPKVGENGAELWMSANLASNNSPYLKDLLASDFIEALPRSRKRPRKARSPSVQIVEDQKPNLMESDDSDDEIDSFLFLNHPPSTPSPSETDEVLYQALIVNYAAFSTYRAALVFLETGYIAFAPLSSSFPSFPNCAEDREAYLATRYVENPFLPLPVSPKSTYRLAHLLQLEELQKKSLEAFTKSLTVGGAPYELFSETSVAYDKIRRTVLQYCKKNWAVIKVSNGWKEMMDKHKRNEMPQCGAVFAELLEMVGM
ncbi:hypothetical protein JCM11641_001455 [Rhodosporidiobolus odoratus]